MTEITRVPLQPIARGSLTKLWAALAIAVLAAAAIAWANIPVGVTVEEVQAGEGGYPGATDVVFVNYTGRLADGTVFDQSQPLPLPPQAAGLLPQGTPLPLADMLPGFGEALRQMQRGGTYVAEIPAEKAYGDTPPEGAPIPPGADLSFTIELLDFMPSEEFEGRVRAIQQVMAQQQMMAPPGSEGGAAGGPPPGPDAPGE